MRAWDDVQSLCCTLPILLILFCPGLWCFVQLCCISEMTFSLLLLFVSVLPFHKNITSIIQIKLFHTAVICVKCLISTWISCLHAAYFTPIWSFQRFKIRIVFLYTHINDTVTYIAHLMESYNMDKIAYHLN